MDLVVIALLVILSTIGFFRGFVKEVLGFIAFIGSICLSIIFNKPIVNKMLFMIEEPLIASSVAYILSFLIFLFIWMLINCAIIKILNIKHNSFFNNIGGALIGIVKTYLICLLIYLSAYTFSLMNSENNLDEANPGQVKKNMPKFFSESKSFSFFFDSVEKLDQIIKIFVNKKITNNKQLQNNSTPKTQQENNQSMPEKNKFNENLTPQNTPQPDEKNLPKTNETTKNDIQENISFRN